MMQGLIQQEQVVIEEIAEPAREEEQKDNAENYFDVMGQP